MKVVRIKSIQSLLRSGWERATREYNGDSRVVYYNPKTGNEIWKHEMEFLGKNIRVTEVDPDGTDYIYAKIRRPYEDTKTVYISNDMIATQEEILKEAIESL